MLQAFDERNLDIIVCVGGRLTHRNEAAVSPFDSSVQGGDAAWEGLRLYRGRIFRLAEHLARLRCVRWPPTLTMRSRLRSSKAWSMEIPPDRCSPALQDPAPGVRRRACRCS